MFVKSKANYLIQKRINLGLEFGCESPEDAYVLLREPNIHEMTVMREGLDDKREVSLIEAYEKLLPDIIIDHNFFETDTEKMTVSQVAATLMERVAVFWRVVEEYSAAIRRPFDKKSETA